MEKEKSSKSTIDYFNRKQTLKKKAHELSTLCDVPVCLLCFDPNGMVETWPEDEKKVQDILIKYKERKQNINLVDDQCPLEAKNRINLDENNKRKINKAARLKGLATWDIRLDYLPEDSLIDVMEVLKEKLEYVNEIMAMKEFEDSSTDSDGSTSAN